MLDLSVKVGGLTFKNPILPAASELVFDGSSAQRVANAGVGGIVTKTFTSTAEFRIRLRPYQFPLFRFDPSFRKMGGFLSMASPHVEDLDIVMQRNIPEIAEVCSKGQIPLIVSFYQKPDDFAGWTRVAKGFEKAGAQMIELNFSSPTMKGLLEKSLSSSFKIIKSVARSSNIPFGVKISPSMEPLLEAIKGWKERGVSFITAHNAPSGIYIDVESEVPFGVPAVGGYLIGRPFLPVSLARVVQILKSIDIPVFAVGGISRWDDALQYLLCGCSLIEVGAAAYTEGLGVFKKIEGGIIFWMKRKGYGSISDFRGNALQKIRNSGELKAQEKFPFSIPPDTPYVPNIDEKRCNLCGACSRSCFYHVLRLHPEKKRMTVENSRCWSCGLCVGICPKGAITLVDRKNKKRIIWDGKGYAASFVANKKDKVLNFGRRGGDH